MPEKEKYEKWKALGICTRCGITPAEDGIPLCKACFEYIREYRKTPQQREYQREYRDNANIECMKKYSHKDNKCWICHKKHTYVVDTNTGESFPTYNLHHVLGNGDQHRIKWANGASGTSLKMMLFINNFPDDDEFQIVALHHECHQFCHVSNWDISHFTPDAQERIRWLREQIYGKEEMELKYVTLSFFL